MKQERVCFGLFYNLYEFWHPSCMPKYSEIRYHLELDDIGRKYLEDIVPNLLAPLGVRLEGNDFVVPLKWHLHPIMFCLSLARYSRDQRDTCKAYLWLRAQGKDAKIAAIISDLTNSVTDDGMAVIGVPNAGHSAFCPTDYSNTYVKRFVDGWPFDTLTKQPAFNLVLRWQGSMHGWIYGDSPREYSLHKGWYDTHAYKKINLLELAKEFGCG